VASVIEPDAVVTEKLPPKLAVAAAPTASRAVASANAVLPTAMLLEY